MTTRHWALTGIWGRSIWGGKWWATAAVRHRPRGFLNLEGQSCRHFSWYCHRLNGLNTTLPISSSDQAIGNLVNANSGIPTIATITGILTDPNFRVVLHALEQRNGTETLAEPEVTTISGRQTQMRATQILTIITSFNFQQGAGGTTTTTTGTTTP